MSEATAVIFSNEPDRLGRRPPIAQSILRIAMSLALSLPLAIAGCDRKQPAAGPPPSAAVTVAVPLEREVVEWDTYTGYLESPESVNVAARVSGMVVDTPFVEGSIVKKGQLLFVIDERPFKADLDLKIADQEKAEAQLAIAKLNFGRQEKALKSNAVSQQDYDNAKAVMEQAEATLAGAKASVEASRLNVEWCQVTSPINGRVSNRMVTVGNLVNGGSGLPTLLTTVQSVDPMYCYFDVDENSVLKYQKLAEERKRLSVKDGKVPCFVQLSGESDYSHSGVLDFVDNRVDPATGTLRERAVLPNSSGQLLPGFFARMRIPGSGRYRTLLIPDTAIGNDQSERNVLVVGKEDKVEVRPVKLGTLFGDLRSITSGLRPDDRVIINGQVRARLGFKVVPTLTSLKADPAAFAAPQPDALPDAPAAAPPESQPDKQPPAAPAAAPAKAAPATAIPAGKDQPAVNPKAGNTP